MPELPEVETIVRGLRAKVLGRTFVDFWTDFPKMIKRTSEDDLRKKIKGRRIETIERRGKNIIIKLSGGISLLIHQKLTGHLLFGQWERKKGVWNPINNNCLLKDSANQFLHLVFWFKDGAMLALSDVRKFAKIELWGSLELETSKELNSLGPDPTAEGFSVNELKKALNKKKGKIKQVLMDQSVVSGIGNIYSDEILWRAKISPLRGAPDLTEKDFKNIFKFTKSVLKKSIDLQGESFSDFRTLSGDRGNFDKERKVYRREGEKCQICKKPIKRIKLGSRSAHFCPNCQK